MREHGNPAPMLGAIALVGILLFTVSVAVIAMLVAFYFVTH